MKILLYADLHGNAYAFDELQKTEDYKTADLRIFLGDAVTKCPYSEECLNRIFASGDVFIMGNHDSFCAYGLPLNKDWRAKKAAYVLFLRKKVSAENMERIKKLKKEFWLEKYGKKLYFTHYGWESDFSCSDDPDEPNAPSEKTAKVFENVQADYIFFAHNHQASDFEADGKKFCCVGSVGVSKPCNHGDYVVVQLTEKGVTTERKSIFFDAERLRKDILAENSPRAAEYANWFDTSNLR